MDDNMAERPGQTSFFGDAKGIVGFGVLRDKYNIGINSTGSNFLHRIDHLVGQSAQVFLREVSRDVCERGRPVSYRCKIKHGTFSNLWGKEWSISEENYPRKRDNTIIS